jgi:hypothetical protein
MGRQLLLGPCMLLNIDSAGSRGGLAALCCCCWRPNRSHIDHRLWPQQTTVDTDTQASSSRRHNKQCMRRPHEPATPPAGHNADAPPLPADSATRCAGLPPSGAMNTGRAAVCLALAAAVAALPPPLLGDHHHQPLLTLPDGEATPAPDTSAGSGMRRTLQEPHRASGCAAVPAGARGCTPCWAMLAGKATYDRNASDGAALYPTGTNASVSCTGVAVVNGAPSPTDTATSRCLRTTIDNASEWAWVPTVTCSDKPPAPSPMPPAAASSPLPATAPLPPSQLPRTLHLTGSGAWIGGGTSGTIRDKQYYVSGIPAVSADGMYTIRQWSKSDLVHGSALAPTQDMSHHVGDPKLQSGRPVYEVPHRNWANDASYRIYWTNTFGSACTHNQLDESRGYMVCARALADHSHRLRCDVDFIPSGRYAHFCDAACHFRFCNELGHVGNESADDPACPAANGYSMVQQPSSLQKCPPAAPCVVNPGQGMWVLDSDDDPGAVDAYYVSEAYQVPTGLGWVEACGGRFIDSSIVVSDAVGALWLMEAVLWCGLVASFLSCCLVIRWRTKPEVRAPQCLLVDTSRCHLRCIFAVMSSGFCGVMAITAAVYIILYIGRQGYTIYDEGREYYLAMVANDIGETAMDDSFDAVGHDERVTEVVIAVWAIGSCAACCLSKCGACCRQMCQEDWGAQTRRIDAATDAVAVAEVDAVTSAVEEVISPIATIVPPTGDGTEV